MGGGGGLITNICGGGWGIGFSKVTPIKGMCARNQDVCTPKVLATTGWGGGQRAVERELGGREVFERTEEVAVSSLGGIIIIIISSISSSGNRGE